MELEQVRVIKEKHKLALLAKKNVVGVAVGFKYINGKKTNELAVIVDVVCKVTKSDLGKQDLIPEKLDGVKTDVVETGLIRVIASDPTERYRPAPGGVSIGHKDVTAGTLGISIQRSSSPLPPGESYCSVFGLAIAWPLEQATGDSEACILSNNHILANGNYATIGDPIYQPGPYDGGDPGDTIAQLSSFIPIKFGAFDTNKVDCALAKVLNASDVVGQEILEIGQVSGTEIPQLGMCVRKYGRTTRLMEGEITQIHVTVDVGGYPDGTARFEDQIITSLMSAGGDSGSLLVERDGQRAIGLLFAGSNTITAHNCIANVEEALGIKL